MNRLPLRDRISAAADLIADARRADRDPGAVIADLVRDHAASYRTGAQTNTLRVAGITATCTWPKDRGLLAAWTRNATIRLMQLGSEAA